MSDILDSIDDILDDDSQGDVISGEIVDDDIDYSIDAVLDSESAMSADEAKEITEAIRSTAMATHILLAEAHEKKAYKALGYDTWADYVNEEFDISSSRSYQLINLNNAIKLLEEAVPDGTKIRLTEAQARAIKKELPEITERVKEETQDMSPDEAEDTVGRIIDDVREQKKADDNVIQQKEKDLAEAEQDGYQRGLEAVADAMLEEDDDKQRNYNPDQPDPLGSSADSDFIEVEVDGEPGVSPQDSMNLYNFVNSLASIDSLPEPDDFLRIIPDDRFDDLYDQVIESSSWLNRLSSLMEIRKEE